MILLVDMNWKRDSLGYYEFVLPFLAIAQEFEECTVKHYTEVSTADLEGCSRVIMSGTALKDNSTLSEPEKFEWLKTLNKPVLGVCAGMQTAGVVFGLVLTHCVEVGMTQIQTLNASPLFSGSFRAYSLHNFSVESSDEFEVLAESEKCMQAMKHKQRPIYGVLFHPEVRNADIVKRFLQLKA